MKRGNHIIIDKASHPKHLRQGGEAVSQIILRLIVKLICILLIYGPIKRSLTQIIHKVANLYVDKLKWWVLVGRVMGGAWIIDIFRIYHAVTHSWQLEVRFTEALHRPEIPACVMSPQSHRTPGQASLHWSSEEDVLVGPLWQETLCLRTFWL